MIGLRVHLQPNPLDPLLLRQPRVPRRPDVFMDVKKEKFNAPPPPPSETKFLALDQCLLTSNRNRARNSTFATDIHVWTRSLT